MVCSLSTKSTRRVEVRLIDAVGSTKLVCTMPMLCMLLAKSTRRVEVRTIVAMMWWIPWPRETTYLSRNHSLSKKSDLARRPIWYVPFTHGVLQKDKYRHRVICPGIAASMGLRCSGRRNALGSVVGRRLCPYFSGTSAILAKLTKSNTNVQSPYRLPLLECTHDTACKSTK